MQRNSGVGKFVVDDVRIRSAPSVGSGVVGKHKAGDTVNYDSVMNVEGRTWISYIESSGNRRYCCAIDKDGDVYIINTQPQ